MMTEDETRTQSTSLDELLNMSKALGERVRDFHAQDAVQSRERSNLYEKSNRVVKHAKTLQEGRLPIKED